eukprot:1739897-Alexandrium_andersonii.AAC.1
MRQTQARHAQAAEGAFRAHARAAGAQGGRQEGGHRRGHREQSASAASAYAGTPEALCSSHGAARGCRD